MKKQVRNFNPNLVLVIMVILCTIASYFVTPGAYDRETVNGITRVVATSYHDSIGGFNDSFQSFVGFDGFFGFDLSDDFGG